MVTRTTAEDLLKHGVYICSVDTGWVSNMVSPLKDAPWNNKATPPFSVDDGASRILDPIILGMKDARGIAGGELRTGVLLRNFRPVCW